MTEREDQPQVDLRDIVLHLAHARTRYPGGLPLTDMQAAEVAAAADLAPALQGTVAQPSWGDPQARIAFVLTGMSDEVPYSGQVGELLQAIIEKGMRLPLDTVAVYFSDGLAPDSRLPDCVRHMICFGGAGPLLPESAGIQVPGTLTRTSAGFCLTTCPIQDILQNASRKKEFWGSLQQLLKRIDE